MSERRGRGEDLGRREAEERRADNPRIDVEGHAREERQGETLREESGPRR